jgi:hypothetical protein
VTYKELYHRIEEGHYWSNEAKDLIEEAEYNGTVTNEEVGRLLALVRAYE